MKKLFLSLCAICAVALLQAVGLGLSDEYPVGEAITPTWLGFQDGSTKVSVKGLPPGLKYTAKDLSLKLPGLPDLLVRADSIYGTPKKSGVFTVTATIKGNGETRVATQVVSVYKDGESLVRCGWDPEEGTVTGMGSFVPGKKVTLRAKPKKGYLFAGWYKNEWHTSACDPADADYRNPSYSCISGEDDMTVYARFEEKEEDVREGISVTAYNRSYPAGEEITPIKIEVDSVALPKVKVKGLPAGLKFNAKTFTITGTPSKPDYYVVTITAENAMKSETATDTFAIEITHFDQHGIHAWGNRELKLDALYDGAYSLSNIYSGPEPVKSLKLPAGLSYNRKTGMITGNGKIKAGRYTATLTTADRKVTTFTVEIRANPSFEFRNASEQVGLVRTENGDTDVCFVNLLDDLTKRDLSVVVKNLPKGLKAVLDGTDGLFALEVEGKTTAGAGVYRLDITVTDKRSGYTKDEQVELEIFNPPNPNLVGKVWVAECENPVTGGRDGAGSSLGFAYADMTYVLSGAKSCTYDVEFDIWHGGSERVDPITKKQKLRLDEVVAYWQGNMIVYNYYFEGAENATTEINADFYLYLNADGTSVEDAEAAFFYRGACRPFYDQIYFSSSGDTATKVN